VESTSGSIIQRLNTRIGGEDTLDGGPADRTPTIVSTKRMAVGDVSLRKRRKNGGENIIMITVIITSQQRYFPVTVDDGGKGDVTRRRRVSAKSLVDTLWGTLLQ